jgi:prepilin peptidase CpaA
MHSFAWWPTLAVLAVATFTDLRSRRIPNWLVLPFLVAGLVVPAWLHGWHGFGQSLEGFGLGAAVFGVLSWIGGMGMGDVKLVAAIGAWIGPQQLLFAMVITAMAGGLIALAVAIVGGFRGDVWKSRKIPYAPAIAIGTLVSFFSI